MAVTPADVLEALSKVQEPELHRDLVTLNMTQDLSVEDGKLSFEIVLTTPACPLRTKIASAARAAVAAVPGVTQVDIPLGSNVISGQKLTIDLAAGTGTFEGRVRTILQAGGN